MVKYRKKRISVLLVILMILPTLLSILPVKMLEVSAASNDYILWTGFVASDAKTIQVEQGQVFNLGDYIYVYDGNTYKYGCGSLFDKLSYSSSEKSVVTVDKDGIFTAKKPGITTITVKFRTKNIKCKFQVMEVGSFGESEAVVNLRALCEKSFKNIPKKITIANGYKYLKMKKQYSTDIFEYRFAVSNSGFIKEPVKIGNYTSYQDTCKLAVPQMGRYWYLDALLSKFEEKNSPTSTKSSKVMKIASISANTRQITVKLKKKVSNEQILATNIGDFYLNPSFNKKTANISMYVYDMTEEKLYSAKGIIKKGSNTMKIEIGKFQYTSKNGINITKLKKEKLKKGHTYRLCADYTWTKGKKVKIK
ncbi:MAG: hypothetical protein J6A92_05440 [Lachnospiraceae bacterium]|nr:hypothetical protein [Lachnospiraceae bacterium]